MKPLKIPTNKTKFFFDKVNGKQFHGSYSECDDFCIRLQVRKYPGISWDALAWNLATTDWLVLFQTEGVTSADKKHLVASYRVKFGNHVKCARNTKSYKKAMEKKRRNPKLEVTYKWPVKCKLRRRNAK